MSIAVQFARDLTGICYYIPTSFSLATRSDRSAVASALDLCCEHPFPPVMDVESITHQLSLHPIMSMIIDMQNRRVDFLCQGSKRHRMSIDDAIALVDRGLIPARFVDALKGAAVAVRRG
jgi:hypothetical protein